MEFILFVTTGFAASLVSAIFGLGSALLFIAVGSHILPVKETVALATVMFCTSTVVKSALFARHINWKQVALMSLGSLPFAFLGATMLVILPGEWLKRLLGLLALTYLGLSHFDAMPKFRVTTWFLITGSAAYGFVSGLLGSGNLIKAVLFREMSISKEAFVGAMAATSILANLIKLGVYSQAEILRAEHIAPAIALVICAVVSAIIGRWALTHLNTRQFDKGLRAVILLVALSLLV